MNALVVGPQCSGSKAVARMLIQAGGRAHRGQTYLRAMDGGGPNSPVVMHCSFPQGTQWVTIQTLLAQCHAERVVACVRSFWPHLHSMVHTGEYGDQVRPWGTTGHHPDLDTAEQVMRHAYGEMFAQLLASGKPYRVVTYRELAEEPRARALLADWCGLDGQVAAQFPFADGNSKWYDG